MLKQKAEKVVSEYEKLAAELNEVTLRNKDLIAA